jgi:hypothetical protein
MSMNGPDRGTATSFERSGRTRHRAPGGSTGVKRPPARDGKSQMPSEAGTSGFTWIDNDNA